MIGDKTGATYSNIEQLSLNFAIYTLRPWLVRIEQNGNRDLLNDTDQSTYFTEFNIDAILRGDFKSRNEGYSRGRQWGWYSANDIRAFENMNPIDNGDVYLSPMNMTPVENLRSQTPEEIRAMQLVLARDLFKQLPAEDAAEIISNNGAEDG